MLLLSLPLKLCTESLESVKLNFLSFWDYFLHTMKNSSLLFSVYSILISINILESLSSRVVVIVRYPSRVLVFNFLLSHSYHQISVSCCSSASENAKEHPSVCFSRFSHRFLLLLFVCSSLLSDIVSPQLEYIDTIETGHTNTGKYVIAPQNYVNRKNANNDLQFGFLQINLTDPQQYNGLHISP